MSCKPNLIIVLSGKRKSGKDYVTELIEERFPGQLAIIHISKPIKQKYSELHGTAFEELMKASQYKEQFRLNMVHWSENEKTRRNDEAYFLKLAIQMEGAYTKKVWLIADARRPPDLDYFDDPSFKEIKVLRVRIQATEETRKSRGWIFTEHIDDATTECGLDKYTNWDYVINNDGSCDELIEKLGTILKEIESAL